MPQHNLAFIIEDNKMLSASFAQVLQLEGFRTECISDGKEALHRLAIETPDLVILDLHLPEVSGVEILDFINQSMHLVNTVTVIISADAVRAKSLEYRANLVLVKPVSIDQLVSLSKRLIGNSPALP